MQPTIQPSQSREPGQPSLTELFHRVNSIIPDGQILITVDPEMPVADALALLDKHGYSQVPVTVEKEVLGLFSYQTFSEAVINESLAATEKHKFDALKLIVGDCMDQKPSFAHVTDEFVDWFDEIGRKNSILVGSPERLLGIVTAMDILQYLYDVASPFVLIGEAELALRALMTIAVDPDTLAACAHECLKKKYSTNNMPTELHKMTFNDYIQIVGNESIWPYFKPYLGNNRHRARAKLEELCKIRNVIFHFRRDITVDEYESLVSHRNWMLLKARTAEARQGKEQL